MGIFFRGSTEVSRKPRDRQATLSGAVLLFPLHVVCQTSAET
jgi:hypothetical protein